MHISLGTADSASNPPLWLKPDDGVQQQGVAEGELVQVSREDPCAGRSLRKTGASMSQRRLRKVSCRCQPASWRQTTERGCLAGTIKMLQLTTGW
jgi:hypothetical protein